MLRTHCQTSGVSLTEQDPYNNVIRTAIEAMAAVLGGTQSLHTNALDEAIALPTEFSARIARNTQLILAEETGVTQVVDPLGGSYYVEGLTHRAGRKGLGADRRGRGAGRHDQGRRLRHAQAAHRGSGRPRQAGIDRGEEVIVGVNKYRPAKTTSRRRARHRQYQGARGAGRAPDEDPRHPRRPGCRPRWPPSPKGAEGDGNLLALCIEAARARATWARCRMRWKRCSAATAPKSAPSAACTARLCRR
jgi:methylmalonyl-CoA mutase